MSLASMTGFARQDGALAEGKHQLSWVWEIKSVNGKSLEIKTKLPQAWEELSMPLKNLTAKYLTRGSIGILLDMKDARGNAGIKINGALLDELMKQAIMLYQGHSDILQKPSSSDLLKLKGVIEEEDSSLTEEEQSLLKSELLASFEKACHKMVEDRRREGAAIQTALGNILKEIDDNVHRLAEIAVSLPVRQKVKLAEQVKQWMEPGQQLSEDRLAQEIVLWVTRADIREEIDRLKAHLKTARQLLDSHEPVGRRLDFLCQELNREANTTCSKSGEIELTNLGMNLKALIEQFREQVQNIE